MNVIDEIYKDDTPLFKVSHVKYLTNISDWLNVKLVVTIAKVFVLNSIKTLKLHNNLLYLNSYFSNLVLYNR